MLKWRKKKSVPKICKCQIKRADWGLASANILLVLILFCFVLNLQKTVEADLNGKVVGELAVRNVAIVFVGESWIGNCGQWRLLLQCAWILFLDFYEIVLKHNSRANLTILILNTILFVQSFITLYFFLIDTIWQSYLFWL